ncbi:hypothetical protein TNCV_158871 [Trichonephila clavipes]|uniref:Uncharacterized protein n=1 Tax=Trichonephila clavipes TaxID=2585209 RepID=A0A8X6R8I4_TRICX|nr:hypothetical protein TNCV_158871 [Trichonephila clavipes]
MQCKLFIPGAGRECEKPVSERENKIELALTEDSLNDAVMVRSWRTLNEISERIVLCRLGGLEIICPFRKPSVGLSIGHLGRTLRGRGGVQMGPDKLDLTPFSVYILQSSSAKGALVFFVPRARNELKPVLRKPKVAVSIPAGVDRISACENRRPACHMIM